MNLGSKYNTVTTYEIQVIETFVNGLPKLMASGSASNRLKLFEPEIVESPSSPKGYYNASTQADEVFNHYRKQKPEFFANQKLNDYEELKHAAISYCEKHELL